ncbi:MAG: rhamnulokinase family protein [Candidatus Latescibacterota bacterium]
MSTRNVLGIDMGASHGRAVVGHFDGSNLALKALHEFDNEPVFLNTGYHWDTLRLFHEIKRSIAKSASLKIDSVGIDTWGVDFGLIDPNGYLLENPHHYRDPRTESIPEKVYEKLSHAGIFAQTGMHPSPITSLFQLVALSHHQENLLNAAETLLFTPDLFRFLLTGEKSSESTIAATSLLFDPKETKWIPGFLAAFGIPDILPELGPSGQIIGTLTDRIADELGVTKIPVSRIAGHDSASAILTVPSSAENVAYVSCGTWSIVGANEERFITDDKALEQRFNNEMGYDGTNMFVKNITGLWVLQECIADWQREGIAIDYDQMNQAIPTVKHNTYINLDLKEFGKPGNMIGKIRAYAKRTNQRVPDTRPEIYKTIWLSLALKYKQTIDELEALTHRAYTAIHIIGGGARSDYLSQLTADLTGKQVISGPYEATVIGNIVVQLIALGELKSLKEAKELVRESFTIKTFLPNPNPELDALYESYIETYE